MRTFLIALICGLVSLGCSKAKEPPGAGGKTVTKAVSEKPAELGVKTITFEDFETGKMPEGWLNEFTGKGKPGKWEVLTDSGNKVLAQVSRENFGYHFNLAVMEESDYKDLEISVRFKGVKGEEDQGGGPVWRYQDADNYYISRANPLENNFRVYKVVDGNRRQMASARLKITSGEWHTIDIKMVGDHIECFYDGKKYLDVRDKTFEGSGKIGLWSKADAVTYFDDLKVKAIK